MKLKHEKYIKQNQIINKLAKHEGLKYDTQYSYNGPEVSRTKFWSVSSNMKTIKRFIAHARALKFVKNVAYESSRYDKYDWLYQDCIRIIYEK